MATMLIFHPKNKYNSKMKIAGVGNGGGGRKRRFAMAMLFLGMVCYLYIASALPVQLLTAILGIRAAPFDDDDPCSGRYIYMYDLPARFNDGMFSHCGGAGAGERDEEGDVCKYLVNDGLGAPLVDSAGGLFTATGWYATDQHALDAIFRNRMKNYACLAGDASAADAVYVPFYAGFDVETHFLKNLTARDAAVAELADWLTRRPEWAARGGRDHFVVAGQTTWNFRREADDGWGNALAVHPSLGKMIFLVVEAATWRPTNDVSVPYPSYFHPLRDDDVFLWQDRLLTAQRPSLYAFAGAHRNDGVRGPIIELCRSSPECRLVECDRTAVGCHVVADVMSAFLGARFCLQPRGDTAARRSIFDALLAGCVPVFFHPASAHQQYEWYLPADHGEYSVFIDEEDVRRNASVVEERLAAIPPAEAERMRREVVRLIPRLTYADPLARLETVRDAFDVAVDGVVGAVREIRRGRSQRYA